MKKTVVLLTLLCVLLVFQGVFAVTPPTVKGTQEYTGSALPFLVNTGKLDTEGYDFYFCVYAGENPGICGSFDASKWLPSEQAKTAIAGINAGKYTVKYQSYNAAEQKNGNVNGTIGAEITPKKGTVTWIDPEGGYVYNGSAQEPQAILNEDSTIQLAILIDNYDVDDDSNVAINVGKYQALAIISDENVGKNYDLKSESESISGPVHDFEITPKRIKFTWPEQSEFVYNGKDQTPEATTDGLVEGDEVTFNYTKAEDKGEGADPVEITETKNVGNYLVTVMTDNTNYIVDPETSTYKYEITPKEVTYTWEPADELVYNGKHQTPTATVAGLVEGDEDLKLSYSLVRITNEEAEQVKSEEVDEAVNVGKYYIIASVGENNSNYMPEMHAFSIVPVEITMGWRYAEPDFEDKNTETEETTQFASHTYDGSGYAPLRWVSFNSEDLKLEDIIAAIKINDEEADYSQEYKDGDYIFTFNAPVDAAEDDYIIEVELTEKAQEEIDAGNYVLDNETKGTFSILPAPFDDPSAVVSIEMSKITIKNSNGDIVAAGTYPGPMLTVNPGSEAHPYFFDPEDFTVTVTLPNGTVEIVDVEISDNSDLLEQFEAGIYSVVIVPTNPNYIGYFTINWRIRGQEQYNMMDFFYIGDRHHPHGSFCHDCSLPATGFSGRIAMPLSVKPENLVYTDLNMSIQIPSMNMEAAIAGVPMMEESWAVEWLGDKAGLLAGSHLPGEGTAVIAAHNTLNNTEYGPFALLSGLAENDVMFINKGNKGMDQYRVYANKLVGPNDMDQVIAMADEVENSLVLVTCENEATEGGYLNRRVVFAKPL